jgi:spermidine synthase
LLLDGDIQLTSRGEFIYHEMLAYVPLAAALCEGKCTVAEAAGLRAFVFGGGDHGVVQRLLRHPRMEKVLQVEIDAVVVNVSKEFFSDLQPEHRHKPRHELIIGDGLEFVRRSAKSKLAGSFDIIVLDTTDSLVSGGVVSPLFTEQFYADLSKMLKPNGILAQNIQSFDHLQGLPAMMKLMHAGFSDVVPFQFATTDYTSPFFCFLASNALTCPQRSECAARLLDQLEGPRLRFLSPEVYAASFVLPAEVAHLGVKPCAPNAT